MANNVALIAQLLLGAALLDGTSAATFISSQRSQEQTFIFSAGGPKIRGLRNQKKREEARGDSGTNSDFECGVTSQVNSKSDKYARCPAKCPYFAQNRKDADHCTFLCVSGDQCGEWNANKPIADVVKQSRTCRGPKVPFCSEAHLDGTDTCAKCQSGFRLFIEDGQCYFEYWNTVITIAAIVGVIVAVLVFWVVDMCCREKGNADELQRAKEFRSRSKIMSTNEQGHRVMFPLSTNCCKEDVAGPGMLLHFNFQAFLIVWPLFVAIVWTIFAYFHNELFILGTRKFGTPRHNCILVSWGYETQQRLMWTKVAFLAIVYVVSFVSFLLFSVRQLRIYQEMNAKEKTMSDFAVELKGLPPLPGDASAEGDIKQTVEHATGVKLVGVSVCWNFGEDQDAVMKAVMDDLAECEQQQNGQTPAIDDVDPTATMGPLRKRMYNIETSLFGPDEESESVDITNLLQGLVSSDTAFVVFKSQEDKDTAMEKTKDTGIMCKSGSDVYTLTLADIECEPKTVNWENFAETSYAKMVSKFIHGFCTIYLPALAIWFFVFYVPYALAVYNFNYDNGAELPGYYGLVFTIVVVGGNQAMYEVCNQCCDKIGFRFKDTKQTVYMLMFLFACTVNVLLDMVVTYNTALKIMVGLDFRTYDGRRLAEIDSFTEQFETYAMQRSLAENTFAYAFPSTFLIPFLIEPFATVLGPYQIGKLIIRTHSEIKGADAEGWLAAADFDLGRYSDLLLNVFLGILIFFFPGGYTWTLFYGMFFSHIVVYVLDHWRVLDVIPSVKLVSMAVDWWAQVALGACCALILSCLVFKANCETYAGYCLEDARLVVTCTIAGFAHFIVHTLLLIYLVPKLGKDVEDANPGMQYETVAKREANSWFSCNPVHCLRSKYIHKDEPYCRFASVGKEHLLEENQKIGCYFKDVPAPTQVFTPTFKDMMAKGMVQEDAK